MILARNLFENKDKYFKCCKVCEERHVGCHADCSRYIEGKAAYDKARDAYIEALRENSQIDAYEHRKKVKREHTEHRKGKNRKCRKY